MFMHKVSTQVVCANGNQPRFLSFLRVSSLLASVDFYARAREFRSPNYPEDNDIHFVLYRFLGRALGTLLLKGNFRVGHLFSEKPCKCFS